MVELIDQTTASRSIFKVSLVNMAELPLTLALQMETALQESFNSLNTGYPDLKPKQREAALAILSGRNAFVRLPTGYRKTVITAVLPGAFNRTRKQQGSIILCICPLIALMINQRRRLQAMGLTADFLGSAQKDGKVVDTIRVAEVECVFASPEAILSDSSREMLLRSGYQSKLSAVVIEEAHCISKWLVLLQ